MTNVIGTTNILEAIKSSKSVKAGIIVTTDKVYLNLEKQKNSMKTIHSEAMIFIVVVKLLQK